MIKGKSVFKYFVPVEKAFEEDGFIYVQGIASGTFEDRDEERMSVNVLKRFLEYLPLPLTSNHPRAGDLLGDMGEVITAKMIDDDSDSLFIKAKLDIDNPTSKYLLKQISKGKKFAFSIQGTHAVVKSVFSERLQKYIDEFQDLVPTGISITSAPSYMHSFLEVVTKSYDPNIDIDTVETTNNNKESDKLTDDEIMDPKEKSKVDGVEVVAEEVAVDEVVVETDSDESEEEVTSKDKEDVAADGAVEDSPDESRTEDEVEEVEAETEKSISLDDVLSKVDELTKAVGVLTELQKSSLDTNIKVLKSVHEDVEKLKKMPLEKRSKVLTFSKSDDDGKVVTKSFKDIATEIVG